VLRRDGRYVVRDRQSMNGTFVNATPIEEHILAEGDEVTVGRTILRFTWATGGGGDLPPAPEGSKGGGGTPGAASIGAWARRGGGWRG
jgi:pSer/pThr/pTyr-binding forkhead associated (FHA) protein